MSHTIVYEVSCLKTSLEGSHKDTTINFKQVYAVHDFRAFVIACTHCHMGEPSACKLLFFAVVICTISEQFVLSLDFIKRWVCWLSTLFIRKLRCHPLGLSNRGIILLGAVHIILQIGLVIENWLLIIELIMTLIAH